MELHHFSDASNVGYGACSYLRYKNDEDKVHCCLVIAKARVAPTKLLSIPRLELSAAVTAARMSVMLKTELEMQIDKRVLLDRFPGSTGLHQQRGTKVSRVRC